MKPSRAKIAIVGGGAGGALGESLAWRVKERGDL